MAKTRTCSRVTWPKNPKWLSGNNRFHKPGPIKSTFCSTYALALGSMASGAYFRSWLQNRKTNDSYQNETNDYP